jgi:putative redox protein
MSSNTLSKTVELLDGKFKFSGAARNDDKLTIDYFPPYGGGEGSTSLELLLISLSTCVGYSVGMLIRKMNKEIKSFQIIAFGERREEHPTCFKKINLQFNMITDAEDKELEKAMTLSEEKYCPVWAMIKNNVEVKIDYKLLEHE